MRDLAVAGLPPVGLARRAGTSPAGTRARPRPTRAPSAAAAVVRRREAAAARSPRPRRPPRAPRSAPACRAGGTSSSRSRRRSRPVSAASTASAGDAAGLALVGRHAERGVALHVLDRAEVLPRRQRHVLDRHVVLQVEPRPPRAPSPARTAAHPHRRVLRLRHVAGAARRCRARAAPPPPPSAPPPAPPASRTRPPPRRRPPAPAPRPAAGTKAAIASSQTGRPPRWQVRCTAGFQPPATARQSAAIQRSPAPLAHPHRRAGPAARACPTTAAPAKPRHGPAGSVGARPRRRPAPRPRPPPPPGPPPCASRRRWSAKTAARRRRHRPAVEVGPHRAGQHHPRPVVVREGDRPLDRAGGEHRPPRRDPPEARPAARRPAAAPGARATRSSAP